VSLLSFQRWTVRGRDRVRDRDRLLHTRRSRHRTLDSANEKLLKEGSGSSSLFLPPSSYHRLVGNESCERLKLDSRLAKESLSRAAGSCENELRRERVELSSRDKRRFVRRGLLRDIRAIFPEILEEMFRDRGH
jgi:hypothetical protein